MKADAEAVAREFHETYERLAEQVGYKTRDDSRVPWEQVPYVHRVLMIAVAGNLLARGVIRAGPELPE